MSKHTKGPRQRWSFKAKAEVVQLLLTGELIDFPDLDRIELHEHWDAGIHASWGGAPPGLPS